MCCASSSHHIGVAGCATVWDVNTTIPQAMALDPERISPQWPVPGSIVLRARAFHRHVPLPIES